MNKFYTAVLVVTALLTLTGSVAWAQGPVGADCTDPPNLVPFADLTNCDLSGREMEGVDLSNANLSGANLDDASLFTTTLDDAIFDNASLRNTIMEDAHAHRASFINADMRGADLYFTSFNNANLTGANLSNMWIHSFDAPGAILQDVNFSGSEIRFVDWRNTNLTGADLSATFLTYVNVSGASFVNATLLGAKLRAGNPLTGANWSNTICPDGSNSDHDDGDNFTREGNFPENMPPTITLTSPTDGATFPHGETITISADAADSDGSIVRVEFYGDGVRLVHDITFPYSFDWTNAGAGPHEIFALAFDNDGGFTPSATVTINVDAAEPVGTVLYVSSSTSGNAGGVSFQDEDFVSYDTGTGVWAMVYDGSDVGSHADINALAVLADGSFLLSFNTGISLNGAGSVDDSDIVRFVPSNLGNFTAGTFSLYFDGSDVGLTTSGEGIDAIYRHSNGDLIISTLGSASVSGVSGTIGDEDLIRFAPTSLGANTSGAWSAYFDGSDVGLSSSSEDIWGAWVDEATGEIYLTTAGSFSVSGASGDGADVFICAPGSLGANTSCSFSLFWDGSANGFAGEIVDGLSIVQSGVSGASLLNINTDIGQEEAVDEADNTDDSVDDDVEDETSIFLPMIHR
jgi:uncharacterized protein YjbI with pentapeptide repeats